MPDAIQRIDERIEKLKRRRAELLAAERKVKERRLLEVAEKRGILRLSLDQIETLFSNQTQVDTAEEMTNGTSQYPAA